MPENKFCCDCNAVHEDAVKAAVEKMPQDAAVKKISDFYKILGDMTRCKIIHALLGGEMCVCDLASALSMTKSSISHQLSKMREHGVVKFRREGKAVYYSLDDGHVASIFELTLEHINHKE